MKQLLAQLVDGQPLSTEQAIEAFELLMSGQASPVQAGALLSLIQLRGPTADELVGAATVMRLKAVPVNVPTGLRVIDTCGTGGDHAGTFNISTAAAIVAAAAGRPHNVAVAKHGNRSVTSNCGSSQVLETLGVNLQVTPDTLTRSLEEVGIAFCFAPNHHPAMKYAAPIRQELGFRTLFNLVGPLTNPAGARRQVIGVYHAELLDLIGQVLLRLGAEHAMVVHGQLPQGDHHVSAFDELSSCGPSKLAIVREGEVHRDTLDPSDLGLALSHPEPLKVDSPQQSARVIRSVLSGKAGPARDVVCLNAAAALIVADIADDWATGLELAEQAVDSGQANATLEMLINVTNE